MHNLNITQMKHHAAIGGVALQWTHLENNLQTILWQLAGLQPNVGRCITQHMPFRSICDAIVTIAHESPTYSRFSVELETLLKECDQLRVKRNDVVHAIWAIFVGPSAPPIVNAGAEEVTGMVIKARGRLSFKFNHMTVSQIDDITEEIIDFSRKLSEFIAKNVDASLPKDTPAV